MPKVVATTSQTLLLCGYLLWWLPTSWLMVAVSEKIVGWAVSRHLQETREPTLTGAGRAAAGGSKLVIERKRWVAA